MANIVASKTSPCESLVEGYNKAIDSESYGPHSEPKGSVDQGSALVMGLIPLAVENFSGEAPLALVEFSGWIPAR